MKKIVFLLLTIVALANHSHADEEDFGDDLELVKSNQEPVFISLGSTCGPAFILRTANLRKAAFPFDWILSVDNEKLIEILDENFLKFLDEDYLIPDSYIKPYSNGEALFHIDYHRPLKDFFPT